jgi:AraC-like DNA-binding protein
MTSTQQVAETIFDQISNGRRGQFAAMTGAKDFTSTGSGLRFRIGSGAANKATHCHIDLTPADTYTVTFYRVRGIKVSKVSEHADVYADTLRRLFSAETGMYLTI